MSEIIRLRDDDGDQLVVEHEGKAQHFTFRVVDPDGNHMAAYVPYADAAALVTTISETLTEAVG
ncbi:hypothetical protein [Mycobacteroides abscessus]|uniref:hypothetical protein n=1 Tax=Mycobacteroides abscessus TaxID=36809 RepID=UPI00092C9F09|nr:hypothetical protein [Mycobacteroides abscessus]SII42057.1 Uncharacterised protein [Mycobacteroides abscessus subsp. abscessus]SIK12963.1 Uncharacterised protein [Mycobacteroides abscessus subsp. abscessus]SIN26129.1 Uncharacterised protein [Mycobacteroides abscessus subsp. abscessus]SLI50834.1 Uncharacterised protein [Mycobacteroides abscessus subsp. abscessus]